MNVYIVGGAVRDKLLNRQSYDKDFLVVGATPQQMLNAGFTQVGSDFPVFLHPTTKAEYALARTERKSGKGYKGFEVFSSPDVTLEEDLKRRDLTINAMAIEVNSLMDDAVKTGDIIDFYGGVDDLKNKTLRHVSTAFSEDPLRVLRIARFYGRFYNPDVTNSFKIATETLALINKINDSGELKYLTAERVWVETRRAIMQDSPQAYFDCLLDIGALRYLMPKLAKSLQNDVIKQLVFKALLLSGKFNLKLWQRYAILVTALAPASILVNNNYLQTNNLTSNILDKVVSEEQKKPIIDNTVDKEIKQTNKHLIAEWIENIKVLSNDLKVPRNITEFAVLMAKLFINLININQLSAKDIMQVIQQTKADRGISTANELIETVNVIKMAVEQLKLQGLLAAYNTVSINDIDKNIQGSAIGEALNKKRVNAIANILKK